MGRPVSGLDLCPGGPGRGRQGALGELGGQHGRRGLDRSWADADADGLLEWSGGDELNRITLAADDEVAVAIRWADPWGAAANDYNLQLRQGATVVAASEDLQAGAGDPFEILEDTAAVTGTFAIRIVRAAGARRHPDAAARLRSA
jgi:hypothetical protein